MRLERASVTGPAIGKARAMPTKDMPVQLPSAADVNKNGGGEKSSAVVTEMTTTLDQISICPHETERELLLTKKVRYPTVRPYTAQWDPTRTPVVK